MVFSKIKKISFILLILFILLFPFWCVKGLCAEREEVPVTVANNIVLSPLSNHFASSSTSNVGYVPIESGYIYYFQNNLPSYDVTCAFSYNTPAVNVVYYNTFTVNRLSTYSFISDDYDYMYFDFQHDGALRVYREKIPGMNSAVGDLVSNVGIDNIWNIFDISINYIVVVVVFAFGCFIIYRIIRKISRGKEDL